MRRKNPIGTKEQTRERRTWIVSPRGSLQKRGCDGKSDKEEEVDEEEEEETGGDGRFKVIVLER